MTSDVTTDAMLKWLNRNRRLLLEQYRHQYVAYNANGIIAHGENLQEVLEQVKASGEPYLIYLVPTSTASVQILPIRFRSVTRQDWQYNYMEDDKSAVVVVNEAFYQAFAQREIKAMNLVWWQGEGSTCIHPGGKILRGWQAIQNSWEGIFRHTEYLEIETEIVTQAVGTEVAYVVVVETVLQNTRGQRSKAQSLATNVFEKMAQKWYLVHHHGSPIIRA